MQKPDMDQPVGGGGGGGAGWTTSTGTFELMSHVMEPASDFKMAAQVQYSGILIAVLQVDH